MTVAWVAAAGGLIIVLLAVGIPYWHTHRRMSEQHDPGEAQAYLDATGRTASDVASGRSGRTFRLRRPSAQRWQETARSGASIADRPEASGAGPAEATLPEQAAGQSPADPGATALPQSEHQSGR